MEERITDENNFGGNNLKSEFNLVYADHNGELRFDPELLPLGATGEEYWELAAEDLVPLPPGADLFFLPGRRPIGLDLRTGEPVTIDEEDFTAVAAILPQGYTRLFLPAYQRSSEAPQLPLYGYTAVAAKDGQLYAAVRCTDEVEKWNPLLYNSPDLPSLIEKKLSKCNNNRILRQLAKCALEYHCLTAQNIFYGRWEGGIPVSPSCNAQCLGCISKQPAECCPSAQERINFQPAIKEVLEIALPHLSGKEAIISFGQGCEGEPLLAWELIKEAIKEIREETGEGTININTNAGMPEALAELARVGLDSARVSIFSTNPQYYSLYHQPQNYTFSQVTESIDRLREQSVFVSINLLALPGFTDRQSQMEDLFRFLQAHPVDMIQMRNLNIDPDFIWERIMKSKRPLTGEILGVSKFLDELAREFPKIIIGNYSRALH